MLRAVLLLMLIAAPAAALQWNFQSTTNGDLPVPNNGTQQTVCLVGDLDGDGVDDFVIAERKFAPSTMAYFLRPEGWVREVIDSTAMTVEAGGLLFDFDGDGDLDLLMGGDNSTNQMWWWENPGSPPYTSDWTRRFVKNTGFAHHHDQIIGDFDGDGGLELVFWNQYDGNRLNMCDVPADPKATQPWPHVEIFQAAGPAEGLAVADINLDGKMDIVGAGFWFEHTGGNSFTPRLIQSGMLYTRSAVAQLVPGGRPEVVLSPGDAIGPLRWYEYVGSAWVVHELDPLVLHGHSLSLGDVDNNGLIDFLVAEMHTPGGGDQARMRIFLNQGAGVFSPETINVGLGNHESKLGDFNGDGMLDIVGKPFKEGVPELNIWLQMEEEPAPADSLAAEFRWIRATDPGGTVTVQFAEAVDDSSAGIADNYSIGGGVTVLGAVPSGDGRTVELAVSGMSPGLLYTLSSLGVADLAAPANFTDGSQQIAFRYSPWARVTTGLEALYDFEQEGGDVVFDVKPGGYPFDLAIGDTASVDWTDGGLDLVSGISIESQEPVLGLTSACAASGEITIEAWVETADLDQTGPARIVTVSPNAQNRNFTLGQGGVSGESNDQFTARMRTTTTDQNGLPTLGSGSGTMTLELAHCVAVRDAGGTLSFYIDGVLQGQGPRNGDFSNWNTGYHLALGGELDPGSPRQWLGEMRLVAVYSRALTPAEVTQNYLLGADAPNAAVASAPLPSLRSLEVTPNPFNARCSLAITSDRTRAVEIVIFDISGRRVTTLAKDAVIETGRTTFTWDGTNSAGRPTPSGAYFFRVSDSDWVDVIKVMLAK